MEGQKFKRKIVITEVCKNRRKDGKRLVRKYVSTEGRNEGKKGACMEGRKEGSL